MPPLFLKQRVFLQNLRVLKPALVDSNLFRFTARVICQRSQSANSSFYFNGHFSVHFKDHFAVLEHLRNKLLPICGSSRRYEFRIEILSCDDRHNAAATDVIESLLQMPQIAVRSNVTIDVLVCCHNIDTLSLLPVEAIAKWLNQTSDEATGVNDQKNTKKQEKFLSIHMLTIQNEKEMVGRLTEVYCLFYRK